MKKIAASSPPAPLHKWRGGKCALTTGIFILVSILSFAQTPEETAGIMVPIKAMFSGMKNGDSAMVHSAFGDQVTFASIYKDKSGKHILRPEPLQDFLNAVGTKHDESWNEPIWGEVIQVDGIFAQVWANYAFYVGKNFKHCGVDTFHLIIGENGAWKIFHLADTRRVTGCEVPEKVSSQFK